MEFVPYVVEKYAIIYTVNLWQKNFDCKILKKYK